MNADQRDHDDGHRARQIQDRFARGFRVGHEEDVPVWDEIYGICGLCAARKHGSWGEWRIRSSE